jgi:hypothetical protein
MVFGGMKREKTVEMRPVVSSQRNESTWMIQTAE